MTMLNKLLKLIIWKRIPIWVKVNICHIIIALKIIISKFFYKVGYINGLLIIYFWSLTIPTVITEWYAIFPFQHWDISCICISISLHAIAPIVEISKKKSRWCQYVSVYTSMRDIIISILCGPYSSKSAKEVYTVFAWILACSRLKCVMINWSCNYRRSWSVII